MSKKGVIFLKILISKFSRFFWILFSFLSILIPLKKCKKGVIFPEGITGWHGEGPAWMQHGTQGHVAALGRPTRVLAWREGDADAWQGHASPRRRSGGATWQRVKLAGDASATLTC